MVILVDSEDPEEPKPPIDAQGRVNPYVELPDDEAGTLEDKYPRVPSEPRAPTLLVESEVGAELLLDV